MNPRRIGRPEAEWVDAVLDDEVVSNEEDGRSVDASGDRGERRRRGGAHGIAAVAMMRMRVRVERSATVAVAREVRAEAAGRVCDADSLAALLRRLTADERADSFGLFCLTAQGAPICWHLIARGAFDHGALRRAEVFRAAIASDAAGIVLTQARPVGRPLPMPEDLNLTAELVMLGQQLDIPVVDHIVLGPRSHASLRRICAALFPTT